MRPQLLNRPSGNSKPRTVVDTTVALRRFISRYIESPMQFLTDHFETSVSQRSRRVLLVYKITWSFLDIRCTIRFPDTAFYIKCLNLGRKLEK